DVYAGYCCFTSADCIDTIHLSELDFLRLLCSMGVFSTRIHVQAAIQLVAQPVLRQHSANGVFHEPLRVFSADHCRGPLTLTARIPGVREDYTVGPLLAGQAYLGSIDDDHVITAIHVGSISGLVFS